MATTEWDDTIEVIEEVIVKADVSASSAQTWSIKNFKTSLQQNSLDGVFPKQSRNSVRESSHSAHDWANEFVGVTHEDGGKLFCINAFVAYLSNF